MRQTRLTARMALSYYTGVNTRFCAWCFTARPTNTHTHTQTHNTQVYVFSLASERVGGQLGLMLCQGVSPSAYAIGTYIWCVSMLPPLRYRVRAFSITHTLCVTHTHTHIHMHTHMCLQAPPSRLVLHPQNLLNAAPPYDTP